MKGMANHGGIADEFQTDRLVLADGDARQALRLPQRKGLVHVRNLLLDLTGSE